MHDSDSCKIVLPELTLATYSSHNPDPLTRMAMHHGPNILRDGLLPQSKHVI